MDFHEIIERVRRHLDRLEVACVRLAGKPANVKAIAKAEAGMKINLPSELREFYETVGNGYSFTWEADPDDLNNPVGGLQVPTLSELASTCLGLRDGQLYSVEQAEEYGFPYTKDPVLAKRTAARMWHWLPVLEEGNGDWISLDLSVPHSPVIFDQHDWLDGGSGDNGHPLAPDWRAFPAAWGGVCFQLPKGLYRPSCFHPGGGVNWDSDRFHEPFRIPRSHGHPWE